MTNSLEILAAALAEFHNWVELPRHQRLSPKLMFEFTPDTVWKDQYKVDAGLPGCYIFEDAEGDLYYVGSVSANRGYGYRFGGGYFRRHPEDKTKVERLGKATAASRIYVVDVPKEYAFISPALEQFLISYLAPKANSKDSVQALRDILLAEGRITPTPSSTQDAAKDHS